MALQAGEQAPDFTLPDQHGGPVSLSGLRGKTVVRCFSPMADTQGSWPSWSPNIRIYRSDAFVDATARSGG